MHQAKGSEINAEYNVYIYIILNIIIRENKPIMFEQKKERENGFTTLLCK